VRTTKLKYRLLFSFSLLAAHSSLLILLLTASPPAFAQATATPPAKTASAVEFPPELVNWSPRPGNPVFTAAGPGQWDEKIRERGWILREGDTYRLWYTGYDGKREDIKLLGYATSPDGLHWTRWPKNPLVRDHWVEDMMVVRHKGTYYMFAEGQNDNHSVLLTSPDGIDWKWEGELDVRAANGKNPAKRPCGTPTVWVEKGVWYLFYEWGDKGVWLAKTTDPRSRVWTNVQDNAVLTLGPAKYDSEMIAMDQIFKHGDAYFAIYHGSGSGEQMPRTWNTDIARSADLVHWKKYGGNPIIEGNKSSGVVVSVGKGYRLYTMHDQVDVFESALE
jgi:beta-1,2-mannobiose phosphorylase / 1,2-beta-oligomannan phosphorylase